MTGGYIDADLDDQLGDDAVVVAGGAVVPGRRQLGRPGVLVASRGDCGSDLFGEGWVEFGAAAGDVQPAIAAVDAAQDEGFGPVEGAGDAADDCLGGGVVLDLYQDRAPGRYGSRARLATIPSTPTVAS